MTTPAIAPTTTPSPVNRVELDPRSLLVDVNIRTDARLDKDFIASIKDLGVLVPITAVRTAGGEVRVRFGHRRTLAAIEADLATVPVEIVGDEATDNAAQIERILTQQAENAHREALTSSEQLGVVEQLSAFGMSAAQVAKRTKIKRGQVDASLGVVGSDLAKAATERYDFLTLEQAAAVAEFDNDADAVKELVVAAQQGRGFDHLLQRLREDRADEALIEAKVAELVTAGITIIDRPNWTDAPKDLDTLARCTNTEITPESHAECPGMLRTSTPSGTLMRMPMMPTTTSVELPRPRTSAWIRFSTATSKPPRNPHGPNVLHTSTKTHERKSRRRNVNGCSPTTRPGVRPRPYGVTGSRTSLLESPHQRACCDSSSPRLRKVITSYATAWKSSMRSLASCSASKLRYLVGHDRSSMH